MMIGNREIPMTTPLSIMMKMRRPFLALEPR
jgi:hypothetical protein